MWIYLFQTLSYMLVLCMAGITGLIQYKKLDKASKLLVWYVGLTFVSESVAYVAAWVYTNNLPLYHIYAPLQFLILSIYFNLSIKQKKVHLAGWLIGIIGIIASCLNSYFFQKPMEALNTNFFVFESFVVIGMALVAFYRLLASDFINVHLSHRFWFSAIFLVFWSFTFFYWLVGILIYKSMPDKAIWLNTMLWFINIVTYAAISTVFLYYNKMKPA